MATDTLTARAQPTATTLARLRAGSAAAMPVIGWTALVLAGHLLAARLVNADHRVHIGAPPLVGSFDARISWALAGAVVLAAGAVAFAPTLARRLRWRSLVSVTWLAGAAWIVALAVGAGGGSAALWAPLQSRYEYLGAVARVGTPASFLHGFVEALPSYPTHVRGHPPGMVLVLWLLDRADLAGPRWAAALVIGAGAAAAPAVLVAMRALAGEQAARRAAPFVAFCPAAVWLGTSADGLFCATLAVGVALLAVACTASASARGDALALLAGLVLGSGLLLSYGLAPLGLVALAVAVATRRWRPLVLAAAGAAGVLLAFAAAGFSWPAGLGATRALYASGVAARRPYLDFLVISPAAFALATGPAVFAGLARLRGRRARVLPGSALAALAVAELSGLSRGETERIWLPFTPWLLLATASLRAPRGWLALQLALAIALQAGVRSPW